MAFEFNNPLLQELRGNNSDSPYIDKSDLCVISSGSKIVLDELPSEFHGVTIVLIGTAQAGANTSITLTSSASATNDRYNDFTISITGGTGAGQSKVITDYVGATKIATVSAWTINPDNTSIYSIACYNESKTNIGLSINSFYVNYLNSIITFNSSEIGQTVLASYKGRGIIRTPAERIYCVDKDGNPVSSFQDIVVNVVDEATRNNNEIIRISSEDERILNETNRINAEDIRFYLEAIRQSNEITRGTNETSRQSTFNTSITDVNTAKNNTIIATNNAISATLNSNTELEKIDLAIISTELIWKEPVSTYSAIALTYPSPLAGWTTKTLDTGKRYRHDGVSWKYIDEFSLNEVTQNTVNIGDLSTLITTDKSNLVKSINEIKNELQSGEWDSPYDLGIEINHNLNTYPIALIVGKNTFGHGGFGEFISEAEYQVINKLEYIDNNSIRLYLSEEYIGTPSISAISSSEYKISFSSEDEGLKVFLK